MPPRLVNGNGHSSDHDLLIRIDTRLEVLASNVAQNHNDFTNRLNTLDKEKVDYKELDVLRKTISEQQSAGKELADKVDWTRRMVWIAIGAMGALNLVWPIILALHK